MEILDANKHGGEMNTQNSIELCNWEDNNERELCLHIAGKSLTNSEHTLTGGKSGFYYLDVDNTLDNKELRHQIVDFLITKIEILRTKHNFNKLAFIHKGDPGPVGLITFLDVLSYKLDIECAVIRVNRELKSSAVKGSINPGDSFLIVSDTSTHGWTIFEAAEIIWDHRCKTPCALVIYDRAQGAIENLQRKGLELNTILSSKSLLKNSQEKWLLEKYNRRVYDEDMTLVDFGGVSETSF